MSEGTIHLAEEDSGSDLEASARKADSRKSFVPAMAVPPPGNPYVPGASGSEGAMRYGSEPPPALPRTSWWRGLIASTLAPPVPSDAMVRARVVATTCVASAVILVVASLVIGLRGEPSPSSSPMVSATIVITRSLLALGILAFSHSLLKMAERILKISP